MPRLTGGEDALGLGVAGTMVGVLSIPLTKAWWQARRERKAQRAYDKGVRGIDGVTVTVAPGRERTAVLEREMKRTNGRLDEVTTQLSTLATSVATLIESHNEVLAKVDDLTEATSVKNGGNTYSLGDTIQRMAKILGAYEADQAPAHDRRKGDA